MADILLSLNLKSQNNTKQQANKHIPTIRSLPLTGQTLADLFSLCNYCCSTVGQKKRTSKISLTAMLIRSSFLFTGLSHIFLGGLRGVI